MIVTGSAKLQNLKANHNILYLDLYCQSIVTGSAKLQNLKANHNKMYVANGRILLLPVQQNYKI